MERQKRYFKTTICAILTCLGLQSCLYIYPIPYPIESPSAQQCKKSLASANQLFLNVKRHSSAKTSFMTKVVDLLAEAKVDYALENYSACYDNAEKAKKMLWQSQIK